MTGEQLYKSLNDLVLYATGAAACSTSDLLMVMEAINGSLDDIERHLNRAYMETWRYIQVRNRLLERKDYTRHAAVRKSSTGPLAAGAVPEDWIN